MPDTPATRKVVQLANEKLAKAKEWKIGVAAAREELKKAIAAFDAK